MKSILYVGATLMIGASIYGFVDYKKASHNEEFTELYKEGKEVKSPAVSEKTVTIRPEKAEVVPVKKQAEKKQEVKAPGKETKSAIVTTKVEKIEAGKADFVAPAVKVNEVVAEKVKKTKKRKLDSKLFSRAPLREDYIEKDVKVEKKKD